MGALQCLAVLLSGLVWAGAPAEGVARRARADSSRATRSAQAPEGEFRVARAGRASTGWAASAAAPAFAVQPALAERIEAQPAAAFLIGGQFLSEADVRAMPGAARFQGLAESLSGNRESHAYSPEDEARIQDILAEAEREEAEEEKPSAAKPPVKPKPKPPRFDGTFRSPLKAGVVTGRFGDWRGDHAHSGLDIAAPSGTPIYASAGGTVIFAGVNGGYGNLVIVRHDSSKTSYYAHCSSFQARKGAKVAEGQRIASVGSTGNSTGPHVHFEIRVEGSPTNPCKKLSRC